MKCVLIIPYFGKFKNYFNLFLLSCKFNSNFDWMIITDNTDDYSYPANFIVKRMSFSDFRNHISSKFDFKINLETPYKLCDYKPAYGYICEEWIQGYDYWGHCDCDLLFGDLTPVQKLLNEGYDKLFCAGHLTIYKNNYAVNRIFMNELPGVGYIYQIVYQSEKIFAFDEVYFKHNVHSLFENAKMKLFLDDLSYNVSVKHTGIRRVVYNKFEKAWKLEKDKNNQLYWCKGHVYKLSLHSQKIIKDEFIYIHLQGRKMSLVGLEDFTQTVKIEPYKFIINSIVPTSANEFRRNKKYYFDLLGFRYTLYRIKDLLTGKKILRYSCPKEFSPYE